MTNIEVPPKPERDVIREVDWLAVAPWLLVLRAVGATIGWPMVIGAIGYAALGWGAGRWDANDMRLDRFADPVRFAYQDVAQLYFSSNKLAAKIASESWLYYLAGPALLYWVWALLGVVITQHARIHFVGGGRVSLGRSLWQLLWFAPRITGAIALLALPAALCGLALAAFGGASKAIGDETSAMVLSSVVGLFAGLPLTLLTGLIVYGVPLLIAAVVIDDADPFDAVSRTVAYTIQRPGSLAACVAIAWIGYCVAGFVISWILKTSAALTDNFVGQDPIPLYWLLMGFFPAYFYTAGVATYLVMRRQVDGQPLDEIS